MNCSCIALSLGLNFFFTVNKNNFLKIDSANFSGSPLRGHWLHELSELSEFARINFRQSCTRRKLLTDKFTDRSFRRSFKTALNDYPLAPVLGTIKNPDTRCRDQKLCAGNLYFTEVTSALNDSGSFIARSVSILRSTLMPLVESIWINSE